jgi:hypothetical protein
MPLFYKILIANAAIVVAGAIAGTILMRNASAREVGFPFAWTIGFATIGVLVTILVNAVILRLALSPL